MKITILLIALLLAGCGGGGDDTPEIASDEAATPCVGGYTSPAGVCYPHSR